MLLISKKLKRLESQIPSQFNSKQSNLYWKHLVAAWVKTPNIGKKTFVEGCKAQFFLRNGYGDEAYCRNQTRALKAGNGKQRGRNWTNMVLQ
jgi:hypothetical protein